MSDLQKLFRTASIQIAAGGSAGFVEVCIMHPLDVVKTRLQLQSNLKLNTPQYGSGIYDVLVKIRRNEGVFAFWKGILPPILAETPKRALKFLTFEQYQRFFLFGSSTPTPLTFSLAGLFAGITESIFVNPFEVVKVTLQSDRTHVKQLPSTWSVTKKIVEKDDPASELLFKIANGFVSGTLGSCFNIPFDVAKSRIQGPQPEKGVIKYKTMTGTIATVYREEGWRALYKGLSAKVMRLGPGGAIMIVVYDYAHEYLISVFPKN